jgi:PleD family two-component response regulator
VLGVPLNAAMLIDRADQRLYEAKQAGRNAIRHDTLEGAATLS